MNAFYGCEVSRYCCKTTPGDSANTYYSSAAHSAKMKAYVHFMQAAHAGDAKTASEVATDDITWDLNAGGQVPDGLPWIGSFKGQKQIFQMIDSILERLAISS